MKASYNRPPDAEFDCPAAAREDWNLVRAA